MKTTRKVPRRSAKERRLIGDAVRDLKKVGIPIGSRALGVHSENSDYDYLVKWQDWKEYLEPYIQQGVIYYTDGSASGISNFADFKIQTPNRDYDIIVPFVSHEYDVWLNAHLEISKLTRKYLENKDDRVQIFEALKSAIRDDVPF